MLLLSQPTRCHMHVDGVLKMFFTFSPIKIFRESRNNSPHPYL